MLGTCVFLWGAAYKLSLYDTHKPTLHPIPEAKLLSKNEDPNASDVLQLCLSSAMSDHGSFFFSVALVLFWVLGVFLTVSTWMIRRLERPRPPSILVEIALFFRPPPTHLVL